MFRIFSRRHPQSVLRLCLLGFAIHSLHAAAMQPLITDDTGTQGAGGNQIEFSFLGEKTRAGDEISRARSLPLAYTRGVSETIDVFAGLSFSRLRGEESRTSGFGSPSVGAKWRFLDLEASGTSFALKPQVLFAASEGREAAGLGVGRTSGDLMLIASQDMPFGALHANAGVGRERYRDAGANATVRRFSLAPVWDLCAEWKLAADFRVESSRAGGRTLRAKFAELATVYSPTKDLDFALGLIRSRDNDDPKSRTQSLNAGLTLRFQ